MFKISLRGDSAQLRKLAAEFPTKANKTLAKKINEEAQRFVLRKIDRGFARSQDPYGDKWDPLKFRSGMPLVDTQVLRSSFKPGRVSYSYFTILSTFPYVATHQYGAVIIGPGRFTIKNGAAGKSLIGKGLERASKVRSRALARKQSSSQVWVNYLKVEIPARQMVPEGDIPEGWTEELGLLMFKVIFQSLV